MKEIKTKRNNRRGQRLWFLKLCQQGTHSNINSSYWKEKNKFGFNLTCKVDMNYQCINKSNKLDVYYKFIFYKISTLLS